MRFLGNRVIRFGLLSVTLVLVSVCSPSLSALELYADIAIDVTDAGFVTIEGSTNHPDLLVLDTQNFTSKTQSYWTFTLTKDEVFSEFVFTVLLPPDASLHSVNASGTIWIGEESGRLAVHGFGQNESLSLTIRYQLTSSETILTPTVLEYLNIVFIVIILVLLALLALVFFTSRRTPSVPDTTADEMLKGLTERQQQILQLLLEKDGPLTQTAIEKALHIPKAAVSRNIHRLERKGLVEIEKVGMSHRIRAKKP